MSSSAYAQTQLLVQSPPSSTFQYCLENDAKVQRKLKNVLRGYSTFDSNGVGLLYLGLDEISYGEVYDINVAKSEFFVDISFDPFTDSKKAIMEDATGGELTWKFQVRPGIKLGMDECEPLSFKILNGPWETDEFQFDSLNIKPKSE